MNNLGGKRSVQPLHIDIAGLYLESLGSSRCVVTIIDYFPCLERLYGTRNKSAPVDLAVVPAILAVVERFVADRGVSPAFRINNGLEYTSLILVDYYDGLGIRVS